MFAPDKFFTISLCQRYGIRDVRMTTRARFTFTYVDLDGKPKTVAQPVLYFRYGNAEVEKAVPMRVRQEWMTGSSGVAMCTLLAEPEWSADEIEAYIRGKVADLKDNILVKGHA